MLDLANFRALLKIDVQVTLNLLRWFAFKCGKVLFIVVQYSLRSRRLEIVGLERTGHAKETRVSPSRAPVLSCPYYAGSASLRRSEIPLAEE